MTSSLTSHGWSAIAAKWSGVLPAFGEIEFTVTVTEAADAVLRWLQARGERAFVSGYFADNPASGRVLAKLGFMRAGRHKVFCLGRGEIVDHYDMAQIA